MLKKITIISLIMLLICTVYAQLENAIITVNNGNNIAIGDVVTVSIDVDELLEEWSVTAFQFDLTFDEALIAYDGYALTAISNGGMAAIYSGNPGIISVAWMSTMPISGSGSIIDLNFEAIGIGTTNFDISNFLFNTTNIENINNGFLTIVENPWVLSQISVSNANVEIGDTLNISVNTTEILEEWGITAFQLNMSYNDDIVEYLGYTTDNTISSQLIITDANFPNQVNFSGFSMNPFYGSGELIILHFQAIQEGNTNLDISNFYYNSTQIQNLTSGLVEVTNPIINAEIEVLSNEIFLGSEFQVAIQTSEIDSNWGIISFQFDLEYDTNMLDFIGVENVGTITENCMIEYNIVGNVLHIAGCQAENLSGEGELLLLNFISTNTGDINLNISNFLYNAYNISSLQNGTIVVTAPWENIEISTEEYSINTGDNVEVVISSSNIVPELFVTSLQFNLAYDENLLHYESYSLDNCLTAQGIVATNNTNPGEVIVGWMTTSPISGEGDLIKLLFSSTESGMSSLNISSFMYNVWNLNNINNGSVTIINPVLNSVIEIESTEITVGETFNIAINTTEIQEEWGIIAYQFDLIFDNSIIDYIGYSTVGTISENGIMAINDQVNSIINVGFMSANPILGEGELLFLIFEAVSIGETDLGFNNFYYNITGIQNLINGNVISNVLYGDADGNLLVQAFDASIVLQYSIGLDPIPQIDPRPWVDWRIVSSDVDGNGILLAFDASLILQYCIGNITIFPVEEARNDYVAPVAKVNVYQDKNEIVFVSEGNLYGFQVKGDGIDFKNAKTEILNSCTDKEIAIASANEIQGEFLRIPLKNEKRIMNNLELDMVINTENQKIILKDTVPQVSEFLGNYPNPFNPTTIFKMNCTTNTNVTLTIYNVKGKFVKSLVNGNFSGQQSFTWNGIDVSGNQVSSGIYFYKLSLDGKETTHKMLMLK